MTWKAPGTAAPSDAAAAGREPGEVPTPLGQRLSDLGYRLGWRVVCLLPERIAYWLFQVIADVTWRRRGPSVRRYEENLLPVLPAGVSEAELRAVSRRGMRSYLRYWCEAFRLPTMDAATVAARVRVTNQHLLDDALARGSGVIAALPHMANWDHAGAWIVGRGHQFTTVAERLRPASLYDQFVAYRESLGMEVLAAADPGVLQVLTQRLRAGRLVCLVADRDLSRNGIDVAMGRGRTRFPAGPARLAIATGAPLLPTVLSYEGPALRIAFGEPIAVPAGLATSDAERAMTQQLADAFGSGIEEHPHDWHMLQRFWSPGTGAPAS